LRSELYFKETGFLFGGTEPGLLRSMHHQPCDTSNPNKGSEVEDLKISEEMIHKLKTEGITMCWADGREQTIRITEEEAEQLRQGKSVKLNRPRDY